MLAIEKHPFNHTVIDNFLTDEEYGRICKIYSSIQFYEKHTDLFHIYQSNELDGLEELAFFKEKVCRTVRAFESGIQGVAGRLNGATGKCVGGTVSGDKTYWFNIFASYYGQGSYLLCHDDLVDDRKYAFTYYLEDFESGDLVLFNKNADEEVVRVKVRRNRMVIFEVSSISFHEVDHCSRSGRKAFTGWYNTKIGKERRCKVFEKAKRTPSLCHVSICNEIAGECMLMEIGEYDFEHAGKTLSGPFTEQRVSILDKDEIVVPVVADLVYVDSTFYEFGLNNYILIKEKESGEYYDMFIMVQIDSGIQGKEFITYVDEDGKKAFSLTFENNSLYLVRRGTLNFFIPCTSHSFYLGHIVFTKKEKN